MAATIKLRCGEALDQVFEVDRRAAEFSKTIKKLVEDIPDLDAPIPLKSIDGEFMALVIEYWVFHADVDTRRAAAGADAAKLAEVDADVARFKADYMARVGASQRVLFKLILATNYLDSDDLLNELCTCVANMIKGKTTEEIRATFSIKNDFTEEEEAEVRRENQWAFE